MPFRAAAGNGMIAKVLLVMFIIEDTRYLVMIFENS